MIPITRQSGTCDFSASRYFRGRGRGRGFTLIEVILATAIAAMIAVSLYAAMSTAFKARQSVNLQLDVPRQALLVLDAIEHQFQSGIPATDDKPFIGYDNEVDFYTIDRDPQRDDDPTGEGERWVAIFFRDQQNVQELVQQVETNLLSQISEDPAETILSRDVRQLAFQYFDGTDWQSQWNSADQGNELPRAIQVTVEFDRPTYSDVRGRYRMTRIMPLPWYAVPQQAAGASTAGGGGGGS